MKSIREKLQNNKVSVGSWMQISSTSIAEIMGHAGYDWIAIDLEHGSISLSELPDLFRAIELGNTLPLARIAQVHPKDCKQALDAGSGGIILPMIENAKQLAVIRDACKWPPAGTRGIGFSRANLFGKYFDKYKKEAQAPLLIAQIECINAVNNLEEILQVDGLDAIMVGPYDLSASMGITGDFDNVDFVTTMDRIINLCQIYSVPCGDHVVQPDPNLLDKRIQQGYRFIAYSTDGVFLNTFSSAPKKIGIT
ncbi:HpcH/HpaI aldolase/citrate lyase family protein [Bacteroidota bacterium]